MYANPRHRSTDIKIIINKSQIFEINFKFNAKRVNQIPQIVSAMYPSRFIRASHSFEDFYYTYFLDRLVRKVEFLKINFIKPSYQEYLKTIHKTNPLIMRDLQDLYYRGCPKSSKYAHSDSKACEFYQFSCSLSAEFIRLYVKDAELDLNILRAYITETQSGNKIYALYKNGEFYKTHLFVDDIIPINYFKSKTGFICYSSTGRLSVITLR
jgi:hypothetical protein